MSQNLHKQAFVLTETDVGSYFSKQLGESVSIQNMQQSFPGLSRETYLVEADVGGVSRGFVLRVDPPSGGGSPMSLRHEWEVYTRLWKSPVPVAEPLWFEKDIDFAQGRPHMVRDLVRGGTTIPGLTDQTHAGARLRKAVVRNHVERLAEVHKLDWSAYGFDEFIPTPARPEDALRLEFDIWKQLWLKGRTEPFPMITEALYWLEEQMPGDTPFVSLVKGNNGVGEEIYRNNQIVALSDWELASLGDGVLDLGFSQGTLALDDFGAAVKYYGECTGQEVSPQRLAYGMFWIMFKTIVCLNTLFMRNFNAGTDLRVASAAFGVITVRHLERRLEASIGKDIVTALHDLGLENDKSTYAEIGDKQ